MQLPDMCDVCGREVSPAEAVRAEMSTDELMCPTSMTFHPACYRAAAPMWHVDTTSQCPMDSDFPELGRWDEMTAPLPG